MDFKLNKDEKLCSRTAMNLLFDEGTGESFLQRVRSYNGMSEVFRNDGSLLGRFRSTGAALRIVNGYIQYTDSSSARLYDPEGKLVFCYPLLDLLAD